MAFLITGFTFTKNALSLSYPIKESIESIEPLCDQIVVTVGFDDENLKKDDGTYDFLKSHFTHKKFLFQKIYFGLDHRQETLRGINLSLRECLGKYCLYLAPNEIFDQSGFSIVHEKVMQMEEERGIEGLLLKHKGLDYEKNEVRLFRNGLGIKAKDGGKNFQSQNNKRLKVLRSEASFSERFSSRNKSFSLDDFLKNLTGLSIEDYLNFKIIK